MLDTVTETAAGVRRRPLRLVRQPEIVLGAVLVALYAVLLLCDLSVPQPTDHNHSMDAARNFPSKPSAARGRGSDAEWP